MKVHRGCAILIICLMSLEVTLAGITVAQGAVTAQIASDPTLDINLESFKGNLTPISVQVQPGSTVKLQVHSNYNGPVEHVGICLVVSRRYNPSNALSFEAEPGYSPDEIRGESYYWDFGTTGQDTRETIMNLKVSEAATRCSSYIAILEMGYYWKSGGSEDITSQRILIYIPCEMCVEFQTHNYRCVDNKVEQLIINEDCQEEWRLWDDCSRYTKSKECRDGRCVCLPGPTQTYRCFENKAQQLYMDENCDEVWNTKNDCNSYSPLRKCIGGVCIKEPPKCDQADCQKRSGFFGAKYCKADGKTYQRYSDCNCKNDNCACESVEKEVPSGTISGHVYDAETKMPMAFATLITALCTLSTNTTGYYKFSESTSCPFLNLCPSSTYTITCSALDYEPETKMITTDKDGNAAYDFFLTRCDFDLIDMDPVQVVYDASALVAGKPTVVRLHIKSTFPETKIVKVNLSFGDKYIDGYININKGDFYYWIPDRTWEPNWLIFPERGAYGISVEIDSSRKYGEYDENNNIKSRDVTVERTRPLRILYLPINLKGSIANNASLSRFANNSSSFIKATYPIAKVQYDLSNETIIEPDNNWNDLIWIKNLNILQQRRDQRFREYDQVVGVLPHMVDGHRGRTFSDFPNASIVVISYYNTPAHEIGHNYGLAGRRWDDEVVQGSDYGNESRGYWPMRHERVEPQLVRNLRNHQLVTCLMGNIDDFFTQHFNNWIQGRSRTESSNPPMGHILWICDYCYERLLSRFLDTN